MTEPNIHQDIQDCQFQKSFIQAGLFPDDGIIVLLTKKEKEYARLKAWRAANPEKKKAQNTRWYKANPEKVKTWSIANHEKNKARIKAWSIANPERKKATTKAWNIANPERRKESSKKSGSGNARYDRYKDRLQNYENISQDSHNVLIVCCAYCGKNYAPTKSQVKCRIFAINNIKQGEHHFYCSNLCKTACPTYHQREYYKFQPIGHTREVPAVFRHMALLDRNYSCEACGSTENGLHVHHINGYTESPMEMADLPNVKVLCAACHKAVHSVPGCYYVDYSCKNQKQ